jgi:hypothetical protein
LVEQRRLRKLGLSPRMERIMQLFPSVPQ